MATKKQKFQTLTIEYAVAWCVAGAAAALVAYSLWYQNLPALLVGAGFLIFSLWAAKRVDSDLFDAYNER